MNRRRFKKSKKPEKGIGLRSFEHYHKMLALCAVSAAIAPFYYTFTASSIPHAWLFSAVLAPTFLFIGYALQAAFARIFSIQQEGGLSSYEDTVKRFQPTQAFVPLVIVGIIALLGIQGVDAFMKWRADVTVGILYDKHSLIPFLISAVVGATMVGGVVLWFYPYNRIVSFRTLFTYGVIFVANFVVNLIAGGVSTTFLAVCLGVFAVLTLLLLNQGYVIKAIDRSGTGVVTKKVLKYNTALVWVLIALFAGCAVLVSVLLGGLTVLARLLFFSFIDYSKGKDPSSSEGNWQDKSDQFVNSGFGEGDGGSYMLSQNSMVGLFIVFLIFVLFGLFIFLLLRFRKQAVKKLVEWIKQMYRNLIHFIQTALDLWNGALMDEDEKEAFLDYVDTTVKMEKQPEPGGRRATALRNYRSVLDGMKTAEEKNRYLYRLLISCWKKYTVIHDSDTPHEILSKTSARIESPHLSGITGVFVRFRYAGKNHTPTEAEANRTMEAMCDMLDRYERDEREASYE